MDAITTYLNFDGNCREAMTFYQTCLGADLRLMTFAEAPQEMPCPPSDLILHATITKGSLVLMASDAMPGMPLIKGNNAWLSINCHSVEEIDKLFVAFGEGGKVLMPLGATFWAARFGMLTDQFGVNWLFNLEQGK